MNRYLKLIKVSKVDRKISCDYQFLWKWVIEFDFYLKTVDR